MTNREDLPSRMLSAVVGRMPDDRREWGQAMLAELAQLRGGCRWSFAFSCLRVALLPPGKLEWQPLTLMRTLLPIVGIVAVISVALLEPEISGAGLAWAYMIYGIGIVAVPTALFGNLLVLGGVAYVVVGHARGWPPWPRTDWLRSVGRLGIEIIFGFLNPLLYLAILASAFALRPSGADWWFKPLMTSAWILLFAFWIVRVCGAAFNRRSGFTRVGVRGLLLASLGCVLAFTLKDAWLFLQSEEGPVQPKLLHLLRLGPLYLIPALLLLDYLRFGSITAPEGRESETSARQDRGFFLLPDRLSRIAVAVVVAGALVTCAFAAHRRSEGSVRRLVSSHRELIESAAARHDIDPRLIAAIVYVTHRDQLSPFREAFERLIISAWAMNLQRRQAGAERWEEIGTDENPLLNVALDISVGLAQIKPRTARTASLLAAGRTPDDLPRPLYYEYRNVEPVGAGWPPHILEQVAMTSPIPVPADRHSVALMLLKPDSNLEVCALLLAIYSRQWEATNPAWSIRERPDILATLYQIGFARSNPHGAPRSNTFGDRVRQVYEQPWLAELFRTSP